MSSTDERTLLVKDRQGEFKITIPADFKVTFGAPLGNRGNDFNGRELRIYEAGEKQRACFTGVEWFRDLSIPLVRRVVSQSGETSWEDDGQGNVTQKRTSRRKVKEVAE